MPSQRDSWEVSPLLAIPGWIKSTVAASLSNEASAVVSFCAEVVEYACNIAVDLRGEYIENVSSGMDTYSIRQPLGVRDRSV